MHHVKLVWNNPHDSIIIESIFYFGTTTRTESQLFSDDPNP